MTIRREPSAAVRDYWTVECSVAREALSARIDGEREPVPATRLDEHLANCGPCRQWQADAVEQTQLLRRLAGRSQVAAVTPAKARRTRRDGIRRALGGVSWRRWALGAVGVIQLVLAAAQGFGVHPDAGHAVTGGHLINESTAWSAALGAAMLAAAWRPAAAAGLAWVLAAFSAVLAGYVVADAIAGTVTAGRAASHLPVVAGAVLAFLVWRGDRPAGPEPHPGAMPGEPGEIVLPARAARGRRRSHLRPTDGSAA